MGLLDVLDQRLEQGLLAYGQQPQAPNNWLTQLGAGLKGAAQGYMQSQVNPETRGMGLGMGLLAGTEAFKNERQRGSGAMSLDELVKLAEARKSLGPDSSGMSSLDKLYAARDRIAKANPQDPRIAVYDAAIEREAKGAPQRRQTKLVETSAGQILVDDETGEEIRNYGAKPREPGAGRVQWTTVKGGPGTGYPEGMWQVSSDGEVKQFPVDKDGEATTAERDRAKLVAYTRKIEQGIPTTPEEDTEYEILYREEAKPQAVYDPSTGRTNLVQPDVQNLYLPPTMRDPEAMRRAPTAASGPMPVPQPPQPMPPKGPARSVESQVSGPPRSSIESFQTGTQNANEFGAQADRVRQLYKENGGLAYGGEAYARMDAAVSAMLPTLAAMGATGVLTQGEVDNYMKQLGDPSKWSSVFADQFQFSSFMARLDEIQQAVIRKVQVRARALNIPAPTTQEQYDAIPEGEQFLDDDGILKTKKARK